MTSKGKGSSANDQTIQERRLRPAYDFLDRGNNKRVIQECDRLLKKQPDFQCAKALKALSLLRSGYVTECRAILDPLVTEVPMEDNTIQALTICLRELGEPKLVCTILENASKVDKSEEMLSSCFMAHVRVSDFQKQYQVALNLYKLHPKAPYFAWAVMSLFVKAEFDPDPSSRISLPLAEKMMGKFFEEKNHVDSEHEVSLYILLLQRLRNYKKILSIIDRLTPYRTPVLTGLYHKVKGECIQATEDLTTAAEYFKATILENVGEWSHYDSYIKHAGLADTKGTLEFLESLQKFLPGSPTTSRAVLLGPLYLYRHLMQNNATEVFDPVSYFRQYLFYYGQLPSYFADVEPFLGSITSDEIKQKILKIVEEDLAGDQQEYKAFALRPATDSQGKVNAYYTGRYLSPLFEDNPEKAELSIYSIVESSITEYLAVSEARPSQRLKEDPSDAFINIAALTLIDKFWSLDSNWSWPFGKTGSASSQEISKRFADAENVNHSTPTAKCECPNVSCPEFSKTAGMEHKNSADDQLINGGMSTLQLENENQFNPNERDVAPLLCLSLLHYCITKSPKSYQTRLLLGKLYIRCGAVAAGVAALELLDFKHFMQISTSYLYTFKLISSANYEEAFRLLTTIDLFFSAFEQEGMEHVLSAYKYGSWEKILEFLKFRDHLLTCLLRPLASTERMLLEYSTEGATGHFSPFHKTQTPIKMEIEPEILKNLDQLTDTRDFGFIDTFKNRPNTEKWKQKSFEAEKVKLRVRYILLSLINNASLMAEHARAQEPFQEQVTKLEEFLNLIQKVMDEDTSELEMNDVTIDVMWPPRISKYVKSSYLKYLVNLFQLVVQVGKNQSSPDFASTAENFEQCIDGVLKHPKIIHFVKTMTLLDFGDILETVTELTETLSFSCILLDLISVLIRNTATKKSKKKRSKPSADGDQVDGEGPTLLLLNRTVEGFKSIDHLLQTFNKTLSNRYPTSWENMASFWKSQIPSISTLHGKVFPYALPLVVSTLRAAYSKSISTLSTQSQLKVTYLEKVIKTFETTSTIETS